MPAEPTRRQALDANITRLGWRTIIGIVAVLTLIGVTLLRAFGGPAMLYLATAAAASVLIATGYKRINPNLRRTALALLAAGALALPFAPNAAAAIGRGVSIAGLLLSLTASVMLIARCAMQNERIQLLGAGLRERTGGHRYLAFTLASQFFSGLLGLAGANLLFIMAAPDSPSDDAARTATVVAVSRGFTAASCWSPVFGNMAILLALYPSLHWIEVFPLGLAAGQITVLVGALLYRSRRGESTQSDLVVTPVSTLLVSSLPLLASLVAFLAVVLIVSSTLQLVISAAIILLAPMVSLLFHAIMGPPGARLASSARGLGQDIQHFPALASEALLFLSAGCAGSILADAFPLAWVALLGQALSGTPFLALGFLIIGIMGAAMAGIHPVLSAVFLASTMTPQVLGLPPLAHIAAILVGWGLSASVTPFSVLSLTASRYARTGLHQISFGANWVFVLCNALVICALLSGYVYMMRIAIF